MGRVGGEGEVGGGTHSVIWSCRVYQEVTMNSYS